MKTTATVSRKSSTINRILPIGFLLGLSLLLAWTSPARVRITLVDASTGKPVPGVLRVRAPGQAKALPLESLLRRGHGLEENKDPAGALYPILDWYTLPSDTKITLPRKKILLEAFSGLESELARVDLDLRESAPEAVAVPIQFFSQVSQNRWFGGNTHLHLRNLDAEGARRYLSEIPYVDRLDILFISYLERGIWPSKPSKQARDDESYITNRYPIGQLGRFRSGGPILSNGEEHRNNLPERTGFGHVMLLGIQELIKPVSIGPQIEGAGSDGTPLQEGDPGGEETGRHQHLVPQRVRLGGCPQLRCGESGWAQSVRWRGGAIHLRHLVPISERRTSGASFHWDGLVHV